jgi:outer membrane protein
MQCRFIRYFIILFAILNCGRVKSQSSVDTLISMKGAVQLAEQNYHLLKARKYEADAASKNVDVVKYGRMPTIDATYQADIGTANNLTGIFYPNGILPISGPPSAKNNYNPATGSAAGILLNWQALTFGQRNAQADVANFEASSKKAEWQQALFLHKINVISSYLDLLLVLDKVKIHEHNIDRVNINLKQSRVLAANGIKPGVDSALFLSELSVAKIQLLNAHRQKEVFRLILAQLIGIDALPLPADTAFLDLLPLDILSKDTLPADNPSIQYARSQYELSRSKEYLLKKTYLPKLNVWGTGFARGSGYQFDGTINTWNGLGLSRFNYGAGFQLVFPIMKYGEVSKQLDQQSLLSKSALEKNAETISVLSTQKRIANATFNSSLAVAEETKQQLKSGHYAYNAMQTRYNTGLVNFSDLIQAQYNLLKAELDSRVAYWDAWKALLLQAAVIGDENSFLNAIR